MKQLLLTLLLTISFNTFAIENNLRIGERIVDLEIVVDVSDHRFEGCSKLGFHLAVDKSKEPHVFSLLCGPAPDGITKYHVIREEGI